MPRTRPLAAAASAAFALLLVPAGASAAQRWAAPDSHVVSGPCRETSPCRIDAAVHHAASGDEVIVEPGTYGVAHTLELRAEVSLHGVADQPRPWLVGTSGLNGAVVRTKRGSTLSHLALDATGDAADALRLQGGLGEDLLLLSAGGNGAELFVEPASTVLRDSVVRTDATGDDAGLRLHEGGDTGGIHVAGVTVAAPNAVAIGCDVRNGTVAIVDTIARGGSGDIDADHAPGLCTATGSNYRPDLSPGVVDGGGNQALDPLFADAAGGDYREAAGSPTIDAGTSDLLLGAADPAGCPRPLGAAVDIGAYEQPDPADTCASAPAEPLVEHVAPPIPVADHGHDAPVIGRHVGLARGRGHVRFRPPGSSRFRTLDGAASVPVGSVIDATRGRVKLASAIDADGTVQTGTFWGARFVVRQARHGSGMTTLVLRGGSFRACRATAGAAGVPLATASRRRHRRRVVRSLWARDHHGRFRTHGANSVATARGTAWLTQDRCDGTRTRVTRGAVAVRDLARHRTVIVRAGHAYLARRRG